MSDGILIYKCTWCGKQSTKMPDFGCYCSKRCEGLASLKAQTMRNADEEFKKQAKAKFDYDDTEHDTW